eukprot:PhF_6_TR18617/c0_g1_i1/m.27208
MVQVLVDPMTEIIRSGEVGTSMFFMMHGLADVSLVNGVVVATLRRGDFFGEMALISHDARRMATVCSLTYCDVLELQKADFDVAITTCSVFRNLIESKRKIFTSPNPEGGTPRGRKVSIALQPELIADAVSVNDSGLVLNTDVYDLSRFSSVVGRRSTLMSSSSSSSPRHLTQKHGDGNRSFVSSKALPQKRLLHSMKSTTSLEGDASGGGALKMPSASTFHDMFSSQPDNNVLISG